MRVVPSGSSVRHVVTLADQGDAVDERLISVLAWAQEEPPFRTPAGNHVRAASDNLAGRSHASRNVGLTPRGLREIDSLVPERVTNSGTDFVPPQHVRITFGLGCLGLGCLRSERVSLRRRARRVALRAGRCAMLSWTDGATVSVWRVGAQRDGADGGDGLWRER